jgi:hypothetical protein
MVQKFDKPPQTDFKNNLDSIKVFSLVLLRCGTCGSTSPIILEQTWAEDPNVEVTAMRMQIKALKEMFNGFSLPSAKEPYHSFS